MVSVRIAGIFGAGLLAMTGVAQASSIVAPGIPTSTPSIIRLQAIEPVGLSAASTPSFVALGDPVSDETVAAIPEDSEYAHARMPMIIRGGVVGDAFATPAPTTATSPAAPANGKASATATPPNGTASTPPNGNSNAANNTASAPSGVQQQSASQKPTKPAPVSKPM